MLKVLSIIKRIPEGWEEHLKNRFPSVSFTFCHGIEEGDPYLGEADILIAFGGELDEERLAKADRLKWIMVMSAGIETMPLKAIRDRNILMTNVRGIHAKPMAEYAIGMFLQVAKRTKTLYEQEERSEWNRRLDFQELNEQTMTLLGTGAIAQETARLAKALGMRTLGVSKSGKGKEHFDAVYKVEDIEGPLAEGDYIAAVLPSTEETTGLLKKGHFESMPSHAVFLNMGRGDLVSSDVILEAVRNKELAHVVLDVMEQEPLPEDHPFWKEENITLTPHISGITSRYLPRGFRMFERNMDVYLDGGTMENIIDPERGY